MHVGRLLPMALLMAAGSIVAVASANDFAAERNRMVDEEIVAAGVKNRG